MLWKLTYLYPEYITTRLDLRNWLGYGRKHKPAFLITSTLTWQTGLLLICVLHLGLFCIV